MLHIHNSLTRQKEEFKPLVPKQINLYVCGMTVYDYCHIGHARVITTFDMITRYLRWSGYQVKHVRNITDIDDKIIHRAAQNGESINELTNRFIAAMHEDSARLGIEPPDEEPRATQYIPQMIQLIETLLVNGHAYIATNGDVHYAVNQFKDYGKLSNRKLEQLQAGARVEISENKHDPLDFVLWKLAKLGEPSWDSPWGKGRPGWHIECSAMSMNCLTAPIDMHGGGMDLLFPHHENEIAQSEGATGEKFVNYWLHVGFLQINKEKMSKSLGNFFTIREVLERYSPEVLRYFMSAGHYRSPLNYAEESLLQAHQSLQRLYTALRDLPVLPVQPDWAATYQQRFTQAMNDDFNTPEALVVLFDMAKEINRVREHDKDSASKLAAVLRQLGSIFGILQQDAALFLQADLAGKPYKNAEQIEALIAARAQARANKNWEEADRLRHQLAGLNVVLEDKPEGTIWRCEG